MLCKVKLERVLSAAKVFFFNKGVWKLSRLNIKQLGLVFRERRQRPRAIFNMDKIREKLDSPARCFQ